MIYLQLSGISKYYNDDPLLKDIDLSVVKNDRYGLVGPNGIGKTTLLKIVLGEIIPDQGVVSSNKDVKIGYVSQEDELDSDYTLFMAMIETYHELLSVWADMEELEPRIADGDRDELERFGNLQQQWEDLGGYSFEHDIKTTLLGLGFIEDDFTRLIASFSGGERNRASLARVLIHSPDLLLLDEPTNHLDIESTIWLENYLKDFRGALIVVSHDRIFLDNVVNKIIELDRGELNLYHGDFTAFYGEREERRRLQLKRYLEQKAEIERIEDFIRRNIAGQKTKQAQSRRQKLSRMEQLEMVTSEMKKMSVRLAVSRRSYQSILEVDNLSFGYRDLPLLENIDFKIERGEKVGLIGRNGIGKTTLVKILVGELEPNEGSATIGRNVDWRYFDQELSELRHDETVINTVWEIRPEWEAFELRSHLARFLFFGDDVFKQVKMLSGGEKKKLALARLLAESANFLILDEPTNHLDIGSREVLEQSLNEYEGAVLFISHDRYFLDSVAQRILAIEDGSLCDCAGNYSYYVSHKKTAEQRLPSSEKANKRDQYKTIRREKNIITARRRRIRELEEETRVVEKRITSIAAELASGEHDSDWEKLQQLQREKDEQQHLLDSLGTEYLKLLEEDEASQL